MKENHEVRDRPTPLAADSSWPRKLAEQTVTGTGNVRAVEAAIRMVIERCAKEAQQLCEHARADRGLTCLLVACTPAERIRALATEPQP